MTKLLYLENTYQFEDTAKVVEVRNLEDGRTAVLLDQTIFYPQGGGQPCDIGTISSASSVFKVTDVRLDKDGTVFHMGLFEKGHFVPGESVTLLVDKDRRVKNAKSHSAGHLVDCAITNLGLALKPTKGYHFSDGPYVEYEGEIENPQDMLPKLQVAIDNLVNQNIKVVKEDLSPEQACAKGIFTPSGKSARVISFDGFAGCGCGGTHVNSSGEIGKIVIRKIKIKNGVIRVCYEVE
jgi:Ser-tRNA(Ala) deacylase AlaX